MTNARFIAVMVVALAASVAVGDVYYVRTDGSDANLGTGPSAAQAFATLQAAATAAVAGDSVIIAPGTHVASRIAPNSGTAGSRITFTGDPTGAAFADIGAGTVSVGNHSYQTWWLDNKNYVTIQNMTLEGSSYSPIFVGGVGLKVLNNVIDGGAGSDAITTWAGKACDDWEIGGNVIFSAKGGVKIYKSPSDGSFSIHDNLFYDLGWSAIGVVHVGTAGIATLDIVNNTILNSGQDETDTLPHIADVDVDEKAVVGLTNNIILGDVTVGGVGAVTLTNDYNDITGLLTGVVLGANSVNVDPLLDANYYPTLAAVIDAGDNTAVLSAVDLDGNVRIQNVTVEMGALEVPEPVTLSLLVMGLGGVLLRHRRR